MKLYKKVPIKPPVLTEKELIFAQNAQRFSQPHRTQAYSAKNEKKRNHHLLCYKNTCTSNIDIRIKTDSLKV